MGGSSGAAFVGAGNSLAFQWGCRINQWSADSPPMPPHNSARSSPTVHWERIIEQLSIVQKQPWDVPQEALVTHTREHRTSEDTIT